jgi:PHD/YefM family antitoxin component YafN of YafNO toxin-antitoxin module
MKSMTLTEARNNLLTVAEAIEQQPGTVFGVLKRGKPLMTLMSTELYEALLETLEILSDEAVSAKLRRALKELEAGKGIPWVKAKKRLGIGG